MPDVWIGWEYMHIKHIIIIIIFFFESNNYIEKNWQWDIGLGVIENNGDRKSLIHRLKLIIMMFCQLLWETAANYNFYTFHHNSQTTTNMLTIF